MALPQNSPYNALAVGAASSTHKSPNLTGAYGGNYSPYGEIKDRSTMTIAERRAQDAEFRAAQSNEANRQRVAYLDNAYQGQMDKMLSGQQFYRDYMDQAQNYLTGAKAESLGLYDQAMAGTVDARDASLPSYDTFIGAGQEAQDWMDQRFGDPTAWEEYHTDATRGDYLVDRAEKDARAVANRGGNITGEGAIFANSATQRMRNELDAIAQGRYDTEYGRAERSRALGYEANMAQQAQRAAYNETMNNLFAGKSNIVNQTGVNLSNQAAQRAQNEYNMEGTLGANYANYMNARGNQGEKYYAQHNAIMNALADWKMWQSKEDENWEKQMAFQKMMADKQSQNALLGSIGGIFGQLAGGPAGGTIAKAFLG